MNRSSTVALTALLVLAGCAGTRTPKLARCTGPYRYANPYGTVLPTLPIPGPPLAAAPGSIPAASSQTSGSAPVPDPPASPPSSAPPSAAGNSDPGKTGGLMPAYPSC